MKKLTGAVLMLSLLASGLALAQAEATPPPSTPPSGGAAKPSAEAVKSAWDFFYKGQGSGVVLAEAKACTEIGKEGETKFECTKEIGPEGVKAGTIVLVWQAYLVPQNDTVEDITLQLKQGDTVRETKDIKVKGESMRTRTWTGVRLPKAGEWTITIARGPETLKSLTVKATK
jgi:hypothetical protein